MQLVRSFQVGEMSRREFLRKATIALGSVAGAQLLMTGAMGGNAHARQVVDESAMIGPGRIEANGLVADRVHYQDAHGNTLSGYLARPTGEGPFPAVLVIQEWWGLDPHIIGLTHRFAGEGFAAFAPDLYHGAVVSEPDEARKLVMELDREAAVGEIRQAVDFMGKQDFVSGPKVGIVGFCMGGGLALQTVTVEPNVGATVAFYGSPLEADKASQAKAPVLGLYGANDQGIPVEGVRMMEQALEQAGIENEIHVYENAGHAFFNDSRASSYNEEASQDAWRRTLDWFNRFLVTTAAPEATTTA